MTLIYVVSNIKRVSHLYYTILTGKKGKEKIDLLILMIKTDDNDDRFIKGVLLENTEKQ